MFYTKFFVLYVIYLLKAEEVKVFIWYKQQIYQLDKTT